MAENNISLPAPELHGDGKNFSLKGNPLPQDDISPGGTTKPAAGEVISGSDTHSGGNSVSVNSPADSAQGAPIPQPALQEKKIYVGGLRTDIEIFPGETDQQGAPTWIIFDPVADTYFRVSEKYYRIISALSGTYELEQFIRKMQCSGLNVNKTDILKIIQFLNIGNLLLPTYGASADKAGKMRANKRKMLWHIILSTYLFFRIPLFKPDKFLNRTADAIHKIFNHWLLMTLSLIALLGYVGIIANFAKFTDAFMKSISVQGLMRYSIAVIFIKIIHEFSHAYTAKKYGCRVRKMGIAVVFFFPRLYSDLTDAWRVADRRKRFLIDGAGIFSELIIGGLAAVVWLNSRPGITQSISYYIFAVSAINTLMINGNFFIKYDGYYMLMDLINVDNLQRRSVETIRNIWRKFFWGIQPPPNPDEPTIITKNLLVLYGIGSFIYRIFLYSSIIFLVYFSFDFLKPLAITLLGLEAFLLIIKPFYDETKQVFMNRKNIARKNLLLSGAGVAIIFLLLVLPLPWTLSLPCEIQSAQQSVVYAAFDGYLEEIKVANKDNVTAGQLLFRQQNPFVHMAMETAAIDLAIDQTILDQTESNSKKISQMEVVAQSLLSSKNKIAEAERKLELLNISAPQNGIFNLHNRRLTTGKWLTKGEVLGDIHDPGKLIGNAYVEEQDAKYIEIGESVEFSLPDQIQSYRGKVVELNELPAALPASPLLNISGGPINGTFNEQGEFIAMTTYYQVKIEFEKNAPPAGRSGIASLTKYSSVAGNLLRTVWHVLLRELSF